MSSVSKGRERENALKQEIFVLHKNQEVNQAPKQNINVYDKSIPWRRRLTFATPTGLCLVCGKKVRKYSGKFFCSYSCLKDFSIPQKVCESCHKKFRPKHPNHRTCSRKCGAKIRSGLRRYSRIEKRCEICRKIMILKRKEASVRKHCSKECYAKKLKIRMIGNKYTPKWFKDEKYRKLIKNKITYWMKICSVCGIDKNLLVHHKDFNHENNSLENLIIVCRSCHMKIHMKKVIL